MDRLCRGAVRLSALHRARGLWRGLRARGRRLCSRPGAGRLMRLVWMRLGASAVGCGLRRCRRLCGRTRCVRAVSRGRWLAGIAAQIPAFGLFDRIGAVMPVAARGRLPSRRRQTSVFRPHSVSAHAAGGKNEQSTQNRKRSCFRHSPSHPMRLLPQATTDPAPNAAPLPWVPNSLKKILQRKRVYPAPVSTIFFASSGL